MADDKQRPGESDSDYKQRVINAKAKAKEDKPAPALSDAKPNTPDPRATTVLSTALKEMVNLNPSKPFSNLSNSVKEYGDSLTKSNPMLSKTISLLGAGGGIGFELADSMAEIHQGVFKTSFAFQGLSDSVNDAKGIFHNFDQGLKSVQKQTGLNVDEITKYNTALFATSTSLAGGFRNQVSASQRVAESTKLLGDTISVARMSGLEFGATSDYMSDALTNVGESGEKSLETIRLLSDGIAGTGISTSAALGHVKGMTQAFSYLAFDSGEAADMIGNVAKAQQMMAAAGTAGYKSPQQAVESYTNALKKAGEDQQSFSETLFYTGVQGGGLKETLSTMFESSPEKALESKIKALKKMAGGKLLTYEEAQAGTDRTRGKFVAEFQTNAQRLGFKSPQEYNDFIKLEKTLGAEKAFKKVQADSRGTRGEAGVKAAVQADKDFSPQLMKQNEIMNRYGGQTALSTAIAADTGKKLLLTVDDGLSELTGLMRKMTNDALKSESMAPITELGQSAISSVGDILSEIKNSKVVSTTVGALSSAKDKVDDKLDSYAPKVTPPTLISPFDKRPQNTEQRAFEKRLQNISEGKGEQEVTARSMPVEEPATTAKQLSKPAKVEPSKPKSTTSESTPTDDFKMPKQEVISNKTGSIRYKVDENKEEGDKSDFFQPGSSIGWDKQLSKTQTQPNVLNLEKVEASRKGNLSKATDSQKEVMTEAKKQEVANTTKAATNVVSQSQKEQSTNQQPESQTLNVTLMLDGNVLAKSLKLKLDPHYKAKGTKGDDAFKNT